MRHEVIAIAALTIMAAGGQELPDAPGKRTVEKVCGNCHGLATIVGLRRTKVAWETTVDEMASRGATGTDQEFDTVIVYLAKYFGKVNVNKATQEEIEETVGLSAADADAILRYRTANGDFNDMADLRKVLNIDAKRLEERKDRIAFK